MSTKQESQPSSRESSSASTPALLICGAFAPELAPFVDLRGRHVRVAGDILHRIDLLEVGIGNLNAALSLERYLKGSHVAEILFVGSCGEYQPSRSSSLPGVVFAREFMARDLASLSGQSKPLPQIGGPLQSEAGAVGSLLRMALSAPEGLVNCPESLSLVAIPVSSFQSDAASSASRIFENLEAYGLARVATDNNVPFSALLAVTNGVGPHGSEEWKQNYVTGANVVSKLIHTIVTLED